MWWSRIRKPRIKLEKKQIFPTLRSYAIITFGLFVNALGWTVFLIPAEITSGGMTGVSSLLYYGFRLPMGLTYLVLNIFLIMLGVRVLGRHFAIKTVYATVMLSFFLSILEGVVVEPIVDEDFMSAVVGGILAGAGVGLAISQGGSTGGTDIIAMMINKHRNISPGRILLYLDIIIISSSYLVFQSIEIMVYGYVSMAVVAYTIDMVLTGAKRTVQMFILSKRHEIIANRISSEINRGITILHGKGWYTQQDTKILMILVRKYESNHILRIIKETDPDAFISVNNVMGVFGYGFDPIKK
ncbi:MAG: YitT family protein [Bacteroidales bacterium]|nr:YitT family protein [Bacteroidales bacterium]